MTMPPSGLTQALADRYRIERELGQGGMATVYLAHDIRHDRRVALKVLRPELAAILGAERFLAEIKTTANLQHPHILSLFDSGEAGGQVYYVMPYVEGESLRDRIEREHQLPVEEAVRIAREVADALAYAHGHGIIHRDIKPENILLHGGHAQVADFGIALAASRSEGGTRLTETGMSLGTPQYMAPEQAMGEREVTARADIYALGCVTYEMLTGDPPFTGSTAQAIVARVVTEHPRSLTGQRHTIPPNVEAAVLTALEKLPADRFGSAKAFAEALADRHFTTQAAAVRLGAVAAERSWRSWARDPRSLGALLLAAGLGLAALLSSRSEPSSSEGSATLRFAITGTVDSSAWHSQLNGAPVVSPDGRWLAFSLSTSDSTVLYSRRLDGFDLKEVPGGGRQPFFSPDGRSLGFLRGSTIWRADMADPRPTQVGSIEESFWDLERPWWHPDGRILAIGARGLWALPATGGTPTLLLPADSTTRERFLGASRVPDGRIMLVISAQDGPHTVVLSADGSRRDTLPPGYEVSGVIDDILLFMQSGQWRATRFDFKRLKPTGSPISLADVPPTTRFGRSLAWVDSNWSRVAEPVWVSRDGGVVSAGLPLGRYRWPRLSPDGTRIATATTPPGGLGVFDLRTRGRTALDLGGEPVWTPDGRHVVMSLGGRPFAGLVEQVADGSRATDTLLSLADGDSWPTSISPDGRWLAYYGATQGSEKGAGAVDPGDVFILDRQTRKSQRLGLPGMQRGARFSPDGRWLAFQSTESGTVEVHVRPWPALDADYVVSADGGEEPAWSHDGKELYFRSRNEMFAVAVTSTTTGLVRGVPRALFAGKFARDPYGDQSYDVTADGRFLMLRPASSGQVEIGVTLNWIAEVRRQLDDAN